MLGVWRDAATAEPPFGMVSTVLDSVEIGVHRMTVLNGVGRVNRPGFDGGSV